MANGATVYGVNTGGAGQTFQTGDTINGSAYNKLVITESGASAAVTATVNNVARIEHKNVSGAAVNYNEALYTGVSEEWVTSGVTGSTTNLTNAKAATTFGVSSAAADALNVAFNSGTSQTFQVALNGAGTTAAASTVDYNGAAAEINAITVAANGTNNVNLNGTTSVRTVAITGAGNNTIAMTGAGALSTTATVTIDASAATGNNTIDLGANVSTAGVTVKGTAGTSTTTLGLVIPAVVTLPTITNVEGLQVDAGSNGTLIATGGNSTVTTVTILDNAAAVGGIGGAAVYNLNGFTGVNAIVYGTLGAANNAFGALTTGATGTVAVTFAKQNSAALATGNTLSIGALALNGATSLTINTANGVGATAATTIGAITSNTLTSLALTNASTGNTALNTVTALNAAGTAGLLSTLNLGGIAGTTTVAAGSLVAANTLANAAVITGATLGSTITLAAGAQTGVTTATINLTGSNTVNTAANTTATAFTVVSADGAAAVNAITTGLGNDVITVGAGTNTIDAGAGVNTITLGTHAAAQIDTINVATTGGTTSLSGLNATDRIAVSATGGTSTLSLGTHNAMNAANSIVLSGAAEIVNFTGLNATDVITAATTFRAGTIGLGAHTGGVTVNFGAAATGAALTLTQFIAGDTLNSTAVGTQAVTLGAGHVGGSILNFNPATAEALTLAGLAAGDAITFTHTAGASSINLGTHTGAVTVNEIGAGATVTVTNNIAGDVFNVGSGTVAGNLALTVGNGSTVNVINTANASTVTLTAGSATVNATVANANGLNVVVTAGGSLTLNDGTNAVAVTSNATGATVATANTIALSTGTETVTLGTANGTTTINGISSVDSVIATAAGTTLILGTHTGQIARSVLDVAAANESIQGFSVAGNDLLSLDLTSYAAQITGAGGAAAIAAATAGSVQNVGADGVTVTGGMLINLTGVVYANDAACLADLQAAGARTVTLGANNTTGGNAFLMFGYSDGVNYHIVNATVANGTAVVANTALVDLATIVGSTTAFGAANISIVL